MQSYHDEGLGEVEVESKKVEEIPGAKFGWDKQAPAGEARAFLHVDLSVHNTADTTA